MQPLSILCHSFRDIDTYTTGFPRGDGQGHANIFRAVKHCLPGPFVHRRFEAFKLGKENPQGLTLKDDKFRQCLQVECWSLALLHACPIIQCSKLGYIILGMLVAIP